MNLYLVTQDVNKGYDTYDSMIVCAKSEDEAVTFNPSGYREWDGAQWLFLYSNGSKSPEIDHTWCFPSECAVQFLGKADKSIKKGVVLASFNAG